MNGITRTIKVAYPKRSDRLDAKLVDQVLIRIDHMFHDEDQKSTKCFKGLKFKFQGINELNLELMKEAFDIVVVKDDQPSTSRFISEMSAQQFTDLKGKVSLTHDGKYALVRIDEHDFYPAIMRAIVRMFDLDAPNITLKRDIATSQAITRNWLEEY